MALIRLRVCTEWSEPLLVTHTILLKSPVVQLICQRVRRTDGGDFMPILQCILLLDLVSKLSEYDQEIPQSHCRPNHGTVIVSFQSNVMIH